MSSVPMIPGDEVVCVKTDCVCHCTTPIDLAHFQDYRNPDIGQHYIVGRVALGVCDRCRLSIPLMAPVGRERLGVPPPYAWPMEWFRPLEYDEDSSVTDAGVHLPIRIGETV